jgi:hypothetical protein
MASALLIDDAHELGNLHDTRPPVIIYPLCCQATLFLQIAYVFRCPLTDSNISILCRDTDL